MKNGGKMTEKRFKLRLSKLGNGMITDTQKREDLYFDKEFLDATLPKITEWLNALHEENQALQRHLDVMRSGALTDDKRIKELYDENEQLKQEKHLLYENIDLLKRFIENQGFKVKLDDKR